MTATPLPTALAARRWGVVAAAGLSGVLVMVSMFVDPVPSATGRELIEGYADNAFRAGMHTNLIHYGFALFAPVAYAIVGLVRGRGAWLANVAGVLAVIGLSTLPGLVLLDFTGTAAVRATDVDTAFAIDQQLSQMPAFLVILLPALVASMLALPVAVAALWRAGLVHGAVVAIAVVSGIGPMFLPWWLGFGLQMVWMGLLAILLWRLPLSVWTARPSGAVDHAPAPVGALTR